jgi:hypothetical protein
MYWPMRTAVNHASLPSPLARMMTLMLTMPTVTMSVYQGKRRWRGELDDQSTVVVIPEPHSRLVGQTLRCLYVQ